MKSRLDVVDPAGLRGAVLSVNNFGELLSRSSHPLRWMRCLETEPIHRVYMRWPADAHAYAQVTALAVAEIFCGNSTRLLKDAQTS